MQCNHLNLKLNLSIILLLFSFIITSCEPKIQLYNVKDIVLPSKPTHDTLLVKATYYYTPIIKTLDYGIGEGTIIYYKGKKIRLYLPSYAADVISVEGFAILVCNTESLQGRYIVNFNYEIRPYIEGSIGTKLKRGQVAVDNDLIPHGTNVFIKELGENSQANDVGSGIKGNHIDYYLGAGNALEMQKKANKMPEKLTLIIKRV